MYGIRVSPTSIVLVYNIYGTTNGDHCPRAREATNSILAAVIDDMWLQPKGPKLIVGDFNASISTLSPLAHAIEQGVLYDIGANASKYGGMDCEDTCKANYKSKDTRRDYAIANRECERLITNFQVDRGAHTHTHAILEMELQNVPNDKPVVTCKPPKLSKTLQNDVPSIMATPTT